MRKVFFLFVLSFIASTGKSQSSYQTVYSKFVLYSEREKMDHFLREQTIQNTFSLPLNSETEYRFEGSCRAVSQFLIDDEYVRRGFEKLFIKYDSLQTETKRAYLEAMYALSKNAYTSQVAKILKTEKEPKLYSICASYLFRAGFMTPADLLIEMIDRFPAYDSCDLLLELQKYLNNNLKSKKNNTPDLSSLFAYTSGKGNKNVFSFQRWNRDFPGMAIVQNEDGSFVRGDDGRLMIFQQLARSGSDLPYFITNGSTPQGAYCITGVATVRNNLIGPSPTLQLIMPYEGKWETYFNIPPTEVWDSLTDPYPEYQQLFPSSWRTYGPMQEVYFAGKIGRTEVIAHGTTIDPVYFKTKSFYPLCPTQGCLCAREDWNITTGKPIFSEQLGLISAFRSAKGTNGYLYVINIDDQQKAVSRDEIEKIVLQFERWRKK
ncbi:MAG: hypothetical protein C5B52_03710 [Bacteroidetes bacterium]|nr:MAG: hypothetical protein C5B52_03710 [Bacteroidota bacterium]